MCVKVCRFCVCLLANQDGKHPIFTCMAQGRADQYRREVEEKYVRELRAEYNGKPVGEDENMAIVRVSERMRTFAPQCVGMLGGVSVVRRHVGVEGEGEGEGAAEGEAGRGRLGRGSARRKAG